MFKNIFSLVLIAALAAGIGTAPTAAQEMDEVLDFTFGKIVRIGKDQVTILEFDFDNEVDVEMAYDVSSETEFAEGESLSTYLIGDEVEIEFRQDGNKRVIVFIAKDSETYDDLEMQEIMMETEEQVNS